MIMSYHIWLPGFLLAALLILRYRHTAWQRLQNNISFSMADTCLAVAAGALGSANIRSSRRMAWYLLGKGHCAQTAISYMIASRNMTLIFFSILALSLGVEFALGLVLGAIVMIGAVSLFFKVFPIQVKNGLNPQEAFQDTLPQTIHFSSWSAIFLSKKGWISLLRAVGLEVRGIVIPLSAGTVLAGMVFASGLRAWWVPFADMFGHYSVNSDAVNALIAPVLSTAIFVPPVENIPLIHALFKTDGLAYPGIISFCLASSIHPLDLRAYFRAFGRKNGVILTGALYLGATLGGLGSTWIYALAGFRPHMPPLELFKHFLELVMK